MSKNKKINIDKYHKCFTCGHVFSLNYSAFIKNFKNQFLCISCSKKYPKIRAMYWLWRYIVMCKYNNLDCICDEWRDKYNGFFNFAKWYKKQKYNQYYFYIKNKNNISPSTCKFTKKPNLFTKKLLRNLYTAIKYRTGYSRSIPLDPVHEKIYKNVTICKEWLEYNGFQNFYNWAIKSGFRCYLTIDRIDNNKGYSPDNCRWVYYHEQIINRRKPCNNKTGYKGVHICRHCNAFKAEIGYGYIKHNIGLFETPYDASVAYDYFIMYNGLDLKCNHKWKSLKELEKEFNRIKIKTYLWITKKNRKTSNTNYIMITYINRDNMYIGRIYLNEKMATFTIKRNLQLKSCFIPTKLAIIRDYILLKYKLKLIKLISINKKKFKSSINKERGFILNFPMVLFNEKKKKQLFRLANKIINKYNINMNNVYRFLKENNVI